MSTVSHFQCTLSSSVSHVLQSDISAKLFKLHFNFSPAYYSFLSLTLSCSVT